MALAAITFVSCSGDGDDIGDPIEIVSDYDLTKGDASDEAKARIQEIHEKYGTYVVYDFTDNDAFWTQVSGNATSLYNYYTTLGDPANVDAALDYLNEVWLKYFPDEFLKKGGMPYKIFLADSVVQSRDYGGGYIAKYTNNYMIKGNSLLIGGMNLFPTMDSYTKKTRKLELITAMWNYYLSLGLVDVPEEFYTLTDYVSLPTMSDTIQYGYKSYYYSQADLDALRNRGFLPNYSAYGYTMYSEIYMKYSETSNTWSYSSVATLQSNDYKYYLAQIFNATDAEVEEFMKYPLVKRKWELLLNYYKENNGIDLRAIATE